jgi:hypothetical protein
MDSEELMICTGCRRIWDGNAQCPCMTDEAQVIYYSDHIKMYDKNIQEKKKAYENLIKLIHKHKKQYSDTEYQSILDLVQTEIVDRLVFL